MVVLTGSRAAAMAPLPPLLTPEAVLLDVLPMLDPPSRITVTRAAEMFLRVPSAGRVSNYDPTVTPYMIEPQDTTQNRAYKAVSFVGPAQTGKTLGLIAVATHSVTCDPSPVLVVHMTRDDARAWVEDKLDPVIRQSPAVFDRLGKGKDDDTKGKKRFAGATIEIGYPTANFLSSRSPRVVLLTDYDHFAKLILGPADSPEGTPFGQALDRIVSWRSRGGVFVESTPARPVIDPAWSRSIARPHEFAPVAEGIVTIYNEGTRARWYWECLDCAAEFEASFDHIVYDETLDPVTAGERAVMICPHCGSVIEHRHKVELNRATLKGRGGWRHETAGETGDVCQIGDKAIRRSQIASYALDGAAAAFKTWGDLVAQKQAAIGRLEAIGDESDLRKFYYTGLGRPYLPKAAADEGSIPLDVIRAARTNRDRGICPDWAAFVVTTCDVQKGRFVVMVTAFGLDGRRTVVDRFDLINPPADAPNPNGRALSPDKVAEDWQALEPLAGRIWPVAETGYGLRSVACVVDYHGEPGVSDNAVKWIKARRSAGEGHVWFTSRGYGGLNQRDRVWYESAERHNGKGKGRRGIRLLNVATDRIKDTVAAALLKPADAEGAFTLPEWLSDDELREFTAENRGEKGWSPRAGMKRNESLDLSVMAQAVAEHKGLLRIDPEAPPVWAVIGSDNPFWAGSSEVDKKAAADIAAQNENEGNRPAANPAASVWIAPRKDWFSR